MNEKMGAYHVVDLSPVRQVVVSFLDLSSWGHSLFGLLEVDVTRPQRLMAEYQAHTGERLSLTGYLIYCLARAIEEDKSVQAYRKGRKQLVLFDDVDVGIMVEHRFGDSRAPIGHVIRRANHKTFPEIHREIRGIQTGPAPKRDQAPHWLLWLLRLPGPLAKLFVALIRVARRRDPARMMVAVQGTVGVTAVGMFGDGGGWGLAAPEHTLASSWAASLESRLSWRTASSRARCSASP